MALEEGKELIKLLALMLGYRFHREQAMEWLSRALALRLLPTTCTMPSTSSVALSTPPVKD